MSNEVIIALIGLILRTPSNWTEMRIGGLMPLT